MSDNEGNVTLNDAVLSGSESEDQEYHFEEATEDDGDEDEDMLDEGDDDDDDEEGDDDEDYEDIDEVFDYVDDDDEEEEGGEGEDADEEDGPFISLAELFHDVENQPPRIRQLLASLLQGIDGGSGVHFITREGSRMRARMRSPSPIPPPDIERGNELLNSGDFGRVESAYSSTKKKPKSVSQKLRMRQLNPRAVNPIDIGESYLPNDPGKVVDAYDDSGYSGEYSADGSIFASCTQDWKLRIYKTAGNQLIREKEINCVPGQWTITDHTLSLDNEWVIYSSITPYVHLTRTAADASDEHLQLDFSTGNGDYGLWSVRFSGDGREIVAGGKRRIYVYDIESRTVLHSVLAHTDDVNSVCFAEPSSSQVIFSGSDDQTVKVWDRRSMSAGKNSPPSGVLVGHTEGITYVTSKGDNRYLASNGKDQKMLLWDLRMMHSNRDFTRLPKQHSTYDYRGDSYPGRKSLKREGDCSVMTFQGHKVLRTLIRCHFSPVHTTGQRYLYTGSADGMVVIYKLDGTLVKTLDTGAAFQKYSRSSRPSPYIARDVSWHPYYPTITSTCRIDARGHFGYHGIPGGLVQHTFSSTGLESDLSDASEPEQPVPPRQRRRYL